MPESLYDTRYFLELFAANNVALKKRLKFELEKRKRRFASAITIYEVYRIFLQEGGRDVARIRKTAIERDFEILSVDSTIAAEAAEIKVVQGRDFPLADAIIAATCTLNHFDCVTDDPHIKALKELRTRWF